MRRPIGLTVLALSACGYPLTQAAVRRFGSRGAAVVEAVSVGLSLRDAVLIASGAPRRLRPVPGALLWGELAAGLSSVAAGIPILFRKDGPAAATDAADRFRRASVALLFALHTVRFWIYLRPDQGRRASFLPQRQ